MNLLSFQTSATSDVRCTVGLQPAVGFGENAKANIGATGWPHPATVQRARRKDGCRSLAIQTISAPVFHGHSFSIFVELERPVDLTTLEDALSGDHVDLVLEETDSPSNLAATGQNDVLVRLRLEPGARNANESSRVWLWAASDNLRL